ncbi:MAG: methyltransferase regulatory domain-containing protein [Tepidisphaerales bacterium]
MPGDAILDSYEQTPYAASSHWETHPDSLASVAAILGIDAPDIRTCRVLEIGCATGGNILPLAVALPGAEFTGIDLSPRQIELARRVAAALGLSNIGLQAVDLMDFPAGAGPFDYIICHGVYSWVPDPVRRKVLELCARHLSPSGIAYISFNTYPGWHLRGIARDMMAFHAGRFDSPQQKVAESRRFMSLAAGAVSDPEGIFARIVADEARELADQLDYYVLHEHLDGINRPFYFHEFQHHLEEFGLTYLSESPLASSAFGRHGGKIQPALEQLPPDPLAQEQYLDFLTNRTFRRSLVCHRGALRERRPRPEALASMQFSAIVRAANPRPDLAGNTVERFETATGKTISTNNPAMKAILFRLAQASPNAAGFEGIRAMAGNIEPAALCAALLESVLVGIISPHRATVPLAPAVSDHPRAFEYARLQASDGLDVVTNTRHRGVVLEEIDPAVLALLDGTRDAAQIVAALEQRIDAGDIDIGARADPTQQRAALTAYLPKSLDRLHRGALLVE